MNRKKITTFIIIFATLILAGIAIFTAIRLFQLRQEPVAPTAPTSKPAAAEPELQTCKALSFTIAAAETASPTPTPTPTASPTPSPTPTPAPTTPPTGGTTTTTTTTTVSTPKPTKTPAPVAVKTATPSPEEQLPDAGTSWPTIVGAGAGLIILMISLLLAL